MQYAYVMDFELLDEDALFSGAKLDVMNGVVASAVGLIVSFIFRVPNEPAGLIGVICGALAIIVSRKRTNRKRAQQVRENKELRKNMAVKFSSTLSDIDDSSELQEWNKIKLEISSSALTESNQRILERELIVKHNISETVNVSGVAEEKYGELYAMNLELEKKLEMVEKEVEEGRKKVLAQESVDLAQEMEARGFNFSFEELLEIGKVKVTAGLLESAEGDFNQALKISAHAGDSRGRSIALGLLGVISGHRGDLSKAKKFHEESLEIAQDLGDIELGAVALGNIGDIKRSEGKPIEAKKIILDIISLRLMQGNYDALMAAEMISLGLISYDEEDYQHAWTCYETALSMFKKSGDISGEGIAYANLAAVAMAREEYAKAEELFERSLEIEESNGDKRNKAKTLSNMGALAAKQNNFRDAKILIKRSLEIFRQVGDEKGEAMSLLSLGILTMELDELDDSIILHNESLRIHSRLLDYDAELAIKENLLTIAQKRGDIDEENRLSKEIYDFSQEQSKNERTLLEGSAKESLAKNHHILSSFIGKVSVKVTEEE